MSSLSGKNIGEISSLYESMYSSIDDEKEVSLNEFSTEELLDMYAEEIRQQLVSELEEYLKEEIKSENIEERFGLELLGKALGIGTKSARYPRVDGSTGRRLGTVRRATVAGGAGYGLAKSGIGDEIINRTGAALGAAGREFAKPGSTQDPFGHIQNYDAIPSGNPYWDPKKQTFVTKP